MTAIRTTLPSVVTARAIRENLCGVAGQITRGVMTLDYAETILVSDAVRINKLGRQNEWMRAACTHAVEFINEANRQIWMSNEKEALGYIRAAIGELGRVA